MIECSILHHLWCLKSLRFLIKHRCQTIPNGDFPSMILWSYHFSLLKQDATACIQYRGLPVPCLRLFCPETGWNQWKDEEQQETKEVQQPTCYSESRKSRLFRYSFPHGTPTSRIERTIYLDDQDLDFGTWLTIIWLKPTQGCDVKICYSIHTKKNGKGTQGLQRGAFVVQGISFKPGSNCQSRNDGG